MEVVVRRNKPPRSQVECIIGEGRCQVRVVDRGRPKVLG